MKKRILILSLALLLLVGTILTGCSPTTTATAKKEVVAYFVGITSGGAAWGQAQIGFETACQELGWTGYFVAPAIVNDTAAMVDMTQTAITNGADVIIGTYYSDEIFGDVLKQAKSKGIYIASTNCFVSKDYDDFWIGTEPNGMGTAQAKTLVEFAGDKKVTVVYMQTLLSATTQNQQFATFSEYLKDYPNITVYGQTDCNSDATKAATDIAALVKANPEINAVVCADSYGALGIANYVEEQGNKDTFISIGIDDSVDILKYIISGGFDCTIAQDFYAMGYKSVMMINDLMDGKTVPFDNDSGTVVVKAADVQAYAAEKGIILN